MDGKYNDDELFFYGAEGSRTLDLWSAIPALSQTELQPHRCQIITYEDRRICQIFSETISNQIEKLCGINGYVLFNT